MRTGVAGTPRAVERCFLRVLLLSNAADFESTLPTLKSFASVIQHARLDAADPPDWAGPDVAMIDARSDLTTARSACRRLTANAPSVAVVAVVAAADFVDIDIDWHFDDVLLAAAGAAELRARLRLAVMRRRRARKGTLEFGDLAIHPDSCTVTVAGEALGLTLTEFRLFHFLVRHAGQAFTHTRLMHEVWGYDCNGRARTVDVHVRRLRAKLGADHESMVDTERGVGYMAVTPPPPRWTARQPVLSPGSGPEPQDISVPTERVLVR
ncbi:response regulator transcription factor [Mycobacterium ulcerans]|uniref:Response regulator transcription factor n=1 Tax=Mycobacterium ulcerans TaxID=1809 RepID=A0ABY3V8N4_MYCUL|nr:response regulator transcription factor [Mycobacterium ulcerans]UDM33136.1 response regulator transcription factor [Mycobacterium ulcerans]ULP50482.1 response regulator transcription factor [Mycobacterium ulcerans]